MYSDPSSAALAPAAAEAARSLVHAATTLSLRLATGPELVAVGGHGTDRHGRLLVPRSSAPHLAAALGDEGVEGVAELVDVAPLPVRNRVRGRLVLQGRVTAAPEGAPPQPGGAPQRLLCLTPSSAVLTLDDEPPVRLDADEYARARADPLAGHEAELLCHLGSGHPQELARLAGLLPARYLIGARRVVPVRLHRLALVLRVERAVCHTDVPVALASARAEHPADVVTALRALLDTCRAPGGDLTRRPPRTT